MPSPKLNDVLASRRELLSALYDEAWGKPWPRQTKTLPKSELPGLFDYDGDYVYNADDDADNLEYECVEGVDRVALALRAQPGISKVLVIRKEYKILVEALSAGGGDKGSTVVIGHPGTGK